jgi:hypothetical protein
MTKSYGSCGRRHGQMAHVHSRLSRAEDDDFGIFAKLISRLELRRVKHHRDTFNALESWNVWPSIEASANGNGIAVPFKGVTITITALDGEDMAPPVSPATDQLYAVPALNEVAEIKVCHIGFQILDVYLGAYKVGCLCGESKIGKGCQVL